LLAEVAYCLNKPLLTRSKSTLPLTTYIIAHESVSAFTTVTEFDTATTTIVDSVTQTVSTIVSVCQFSSTPSVSPTVMDTDCSSQPGLFALLATTCTDPSNGLYAVIGLGDNNHYLPYFHKTSLAAKLPTQFYINRGSLFTHGTTGYGPAGIALGSNFSPFYFASPGVTPPSAANCSIDVDGYLQCSALTDAGNTATMFETCGSSQYLGFGDMNGIADSGPGCTLLKLRAVYLCFP